MATKIAKPKRVREYGNDELPEEIMAEMEAKVRGDRPGLNGDDKPAPKMKGGVAKAKRALAKAGREIEGNGEAEALPTAAPRGVSLGKGKKGQITPKVAQSFKGGKGGKPDAKGRLEFKVEAYRGDKELTYDQVCELIGLHEVQEAGAPSKFSFGGKRYALANNSTNRPFRIGLANRYKSEILRGKWCMNGETIVFDEHAQCQSGQHRFVGFIMAVLEWRAQKQVKPADRKPDWHVYWKKEPTLPAIVVWGISSKPEVVDTIDQGQKRSNGDVIYRDGYFTDGYIDMQGAEDVAVGTKGGQQPKGARVGKLQVVASDKVRRKLCNILAGAARLVWLRQGGQSVSDAPHFPVSECLDFIRQHKRLEQFVLQVYNLDGGPGTAGGDKIGKFCSLAYAAALYYCMSVSGSDAEEYAEGGVETLDFGMEKKAAEFWAKFASGAELKADDPILLARELLPRIDAGSALGRDEKVAVIIKAFNLWMDGPKGKGKDAAFGCKAKDLQVRKAATDTGVEKLAEDPRLGGIDVEGREKEEVASREDSLGEIENDTTREGSKAGKQWSEGDSAWVKSSDGDHWFGVIGQVYKGEGKVPDSADLTGDNGVPYNEDLSKLSVKYPGAKGK